MREYNVFPDTRRKYPFGSSAANRHRSRLTYQGLCWAYAMLPRSVRSPSLRVMSPIMAAKMLVYTIPSVSQKERQRYPRMMTTHLPGSDFTHYAYEFAASDVEADILEGRHGLRLRPSKICFADCKNLRKSFSYRRSLRSSWPTSSFVGS
jgi:hypothetical protein